MTLPSLRKRRITRPSTLRSRFVDRLLGTALICAIVGGTRSATAAPPNAPPTGPVIVASKLKSRVRPVSGAEADPFLEDQPAALTPPDPNEGVHAGRSANESRAATGSKKPRPRLARKPGRAAVRPVDYQQEELSGEPEPQTGEFVRPLRKIADIAPYYDYEPDPEVAAQDRCYNLCPRPKDAGCPECREGDEEGRLENGMLCPDCPAEKDIRRINRQPGEPDREYIPRNFAFIHYAWEPTNLYHLPIYFEDFTLERYGHTRHYLIQPVFSGAKFAVQFLGLPYQLTLCPPLSKQYSLGYYRPGDFVPCKYYQIPWNATAAAVEAGVITGAYFLFAPGVGP